MTNIAVKIEDLGNHVDRVIGELLNQVVMEVVDDKVYIFSSQETINLAIQTSASSMIPKAMYILRETELGAVNFL